MLPCAMSSELTARQGNHSNIKLGNQEITEHSIDQRLLLGNAF